MNNNYLDNLSPKSLEKIQHTDFRSREGYQLKKIIGIKSSQVIKKKIKDFLAGKKKTFRLKCFGKNLDNTRHIIKIQSLIRRYNIIFKMKYFGPFFFNQNISNNSFDFFSYQDIKSIPLDYLISYKDDDKFVYTFDIRSLDKLFSCQSYENPFNRQPLPKRILNLVKVRISKVNIIQTSKNKRRKKNETIEEINSNIKIRAIDLFQKMDKLDQYTNVSWFCDLNLKQLKNFYRFLEDIWNYRTQLTPQQKKKISKNGDVCSISLSKIFKIKKIAEIQRIVLDQIELLITGGETRDEQVLGCLYILTAFAETSPKIAECLPWLINS